MANNLHRRISFGLFEFELETGTLKREGASVKLAPQPARVLALLVSRPGEVVLRDEFRRELWGDETFVDFERGLNFCITQVRTALGDSSDNPRFVQTVPRRGYRFIAPVASAQAPTAAATSPAGATFPSPHATGGSRFQPPSAEPLAAPAVSATQSPASIRTSPQWLAVFGIALIALITWWAVANRQASVPTQAMTSVASPLRIAVLPFANLTGDTTADYLADGLTDEVITQLGAIGGQRLAVIARTSAMSYRATPRSIADIARELDVQYVVEGAVRRDGNGLRVNGRLITASTQTALTQWEERFENESSALATREAHASIRIARRAAIALTAREPERNDAATTDIRAWDEYLQGTASLNRGTPDATRQAITQLENAVERDPTFAGAWARLAEARHQLVMMGAVSPADAYPAAEAAARQGLAADAQLPASYLATGLVQLWYNWRPADAAASFERALALNPSLAAAHHDYAWSLVALGRIDDAVRHIERARELDPLSTRANNDVGWLYLHVRQPEAAAQACQHTLAIDDGSLEAQACLERAFAQRQLFDAALQAARTTLPPGEDVRPRVTATGAAGLQEIWRWRLRQLEQASTTRWVSPYTLATHYVLTGDNERALTALEQAYETRSGMMVFLPRDPVMDPIRSHPRYVSLVRKITSPPS